MDNGRSTGRARPVIRAGDTATLKKPHPCGSHDFRVVRAGADVRIVCLGCGRDMTLPREKFERSLKKLAYAPVPEDGSEQKNKG